MGGLTEGLTALKNGDIDAAAILEPVFSEQADENWKVVFKASDYVPEFMSTVIISGPGVLEKDRALVQKTIQARADGIEFLKRDPDAVAEAWAKEAEIEPESARKALEAVDPDEALGRRAGLAGGAGDGRRGDAADRPAAGRPAHRLERPRRPGLHPARPTHRAPRRLTVAPHRREREQDLRRQSRRCATCRSRSTRASSSRSSGPSGCGKIDPDGDRRRADRADQRRRSPSATRRSTAPTPTIGHRLPAGVRVPVAHDHRERRVRARDDGRRQGGTPHPRPRT